jgi:hypothetical protein
MIRHRKILGRGDSPTGGVTPKVSDWHDTHFSPDFLIFQLGGIDGTPTIDEGSVPLEISGTQNRGVWRGRYDFSFIDTIWVEVNSPFDSETLSGVYAAQYSLDEGVTWAYFDGISGPFVSISSAIHYATVLQGQPVVVSAAAKTDVVIRYVGSGFDGLAYAPGTISLWGR